MKRKIIFIVVFSYLALILIILILALNLPRNNQPVRTKIESLPDRVDEVEQASSQTPADFTGTHTSTGSPTPGPETELSPNPSPTAESTITEVVETPTVTEPTSVVPSPSSTSEAYPINGDPAPTIISQPYPVEGSTEVTSTPTSTISPTPTPGTQTGWAGEWTVFWEQPDGSYLSAEMRVDIIGSDVSASLLFGGDQVSFEGILNESSVIVVGTWIDSTEGGNFYWRSYSTDHFIGSLNQEMGFCGVRESDILPESCKKIPSDY